jgi:hypothetical protein
LQTEDVFLAGGGFHGAKLRNLSRGALCGERRIFPEI